jgi:signal transduction histidine kinase/ActR/RegA family two-component response regulator
VVAVSGVEPQPDFRALFESAPGLYLVLEPSFRIVAVSDAYLAATMTRRADILGRGIFDVFPDNPDDPTATGERNLRASLERVRDESSPDVMAVQKYDIRRPADEGGGFEERFWSPRNCPVLTDDGQLSYIIHRVEDVTEFVRLQQRGSEQEREILQRQRELAQANRELRAADNAKSEFLSRVSHELRTPLTAIVGFSELLTHCDLAEREEEWATIILRAGRHLTQLVDEVLDLSRIETGNLTLRLEPVPLGPLFHDAMELVRPLAERHGITLLSPRSAAGHGYAYADRQRLQQVLINLLVNAIKYNRPGGEVQIVVEGVPGEPVHIAVRDTGPGLDPASIDKLFIPFERLGAALSNIEGSGLGLALSRNLVEKMSGTIEVESVLGTGSRFIVALPCGEPPAVEAPAPVDGAPLPEVGYDVEKRVLYIEDTIVNIKLVEAILARRPSLRLIPAMQGRLGLDLAREHRPDLILLDLHLPDMTGADVLAELRAAPSTRDTPVVILSANAATTEAETLLGAGADRYLTKPIAVTELLVTVDELVTSASPADSR